MQIWSFSGQESRVYFMLRRANTVIACNGSSSRDNSLTKFWKTPCVSRLRIHVFDHILLFSHLEKRFLGRLRSKIMAAASKCFRLAVAILFAYIISRDAARWRLGTKKQGRARARDRQKKSPSVSATQIACDFCWRSNSPRSANKIA